MMFALLMIGVSGWAQSKKQAKQKTPEQMAKQRSEVWAKEFGLSAEQKQQVYDLQVERFSRIKQKRNSELTKDERVKQNQAYRTEYREKVKTILTPEQYEKWQLKQENAKKKVEKKQKGKTSKKGGSNNVSPEPVVDDSAEVDVM